MFAVYLTRPRLLAEPGDDDDIREFLGIYPTRLKAEGLINALKIVNKCPKCGRPVKVGKYMVRCKGNYSRQRWVCDWEMSLQMDIEEHPGESTVIEVLKASLNWIYP